MIFHDQEIVQKVRGERKKGKSLKKLSEKFGIADTTISRWVRDIPSDAQIFYTARNREKFLKSQLQGMWENLPIGEDLAKIFVSLLYWCEGSKYPSTGGIAFSNSDPTMVKTFLELLRLGFKIREEKIRIHLQLHSTHSQKKMMSFWSQLLHIPLKQFYKPTITNPTRKMKRLDYKGTCTIKYYDVRLVLKIMGLYESLAHRYENNGEVPKPG